MKEAFENIDTIIGNGGKAYNLIVFERLLYDVEAKFLDSVRIVAYDIEGQPSLRYLFYDGNKIVFVDDNTKQDLGLKSINFYYENKIVIEKSNLGSTYKLYDDGKYITDIFGYLKK